MFFIFFISLQLIFFNAKLSYCIGAENANYHESASFTTHCLTQSFEWMFCSAMSWWNYVCKLIFKSENCITFLCIIWDWNRKCWLQFLKMTSGDIWLWNKLQTNRRAGNWRTRRALTQSLNWTFYMVLKNFFLSFSRFKFLTTVVHHFITIDETEDNLKRQLEFTVTSILGWLWPHMKMVFVVLVVWSHPLTNLPEGLPIFSVSLSYLSSFLYHLPNTQCTVPLSPYGTYTNKPLHTCQLGDRRGLGVAAKQRRRRWE